MFEHFVIAQDLVYPQVLAELRAGEKRTHWMWFVFPQLRALGRSERAVRYGLAGLDDARAYLAHNVLGARLRECTEIVLAVEGRTAVETFGEIDAMKFRSSMTLFAHVAPDEAMWREAIAKFYGGVEDAVTVESLVRP
jgi:uncharacterized protein (DUF1810 family)